jgi:hypothetical protein
LIALAESEGKESSRSLDLSSNFVADDSTLLPKYAPGTRSLSCTAQSLPS